MTGFRAPSPLEKYFSENIVIFISQKISAAEFKHCLLPRALSLFISINRRSNSPCVLFRSVVFVEFESN